VFQASRDQDWSGGDAVVSEEERLAWQGAHCSCERGTLLSRLVEVRARQGWSEECGCATRWDLALACFAANQLVLADPAPDESRACEAANPREAKSLADVLYEKREFQRAGECYEAAGDPSRAQLAFV